MVSKRTKRKLKTYFLLFVVCTILALIASFCIEEYTKNGSQHFPSHSVPKKPVKKN